MQGWVIRHRCADNGLLFYRLPRIMKFFKIAIVILLAGLKAATAQEQQAITLTEEGSLILALENNFEIKIQSAFPEIGEQETSEAESEFDPILFGGIGHNRSVTPSSSAFADPQVGDATEELFSLGVKQKLKLGTGYEFLLGATKTETNSIYASLNPQYSPSLTLSLNQPLLKGAGWKINETGIIIAKNAKTISDDQFALKVMEILTRTRSAYWDLVFLNKELEVLEESLERARDFLKRIELRVEVGALAPIEIAAAEAEVAVREEALIDVRHHIDNVQDALKALINKKSAQPGSNVRIEPADIPEYQETELDIERLKKAAYENRPDYHAAKIQIENNKRRLAYNKNQLRPKFDIESSIKLKAIRGNAQTVGFGSTSLPESPFGGDASDALGDMASGKYYDFSIGLVAEYPLYNRAGKSRVASNMLELNISETRLLKLKQAIDIELFKATRDIETARQRIRATKASRFFAEKKLSAEVEKYDVGISTSFTVLEYQNDLAAQKSREIKAITDYIKAVARLELATGSVLKNRNISFESAAP